MSTGELLKSEVEDLVLHFRGTTESDIANTLLNTIDSVLENIEVWDVLWEPEKELVGTLENIVHAKSMLSPELYSAIWEENIMNPDMTFEKLRTIWIAEPGINPDKYSQGGIDIKIIRALGWKIIADKRTTVGKLTLFQHWATPEWIGGKIEKLWEGWFLDMEISAIAIELF
jgi:hypothetical protein